jgi:hypothetical protein
MFLNDERSEPTSNDAAIRETQWRSMLETARQQLPPAIQQYVTAARGTHREDQPNEVAVAIDLPASARIFFGPWVWSEERQEYTVSGPWRNKPFQVAGGNMEEFGDLLDAVARAREVYRQWQLRESKP